MKMEVEVDCIFASVYICKLGEVKLFPWFNPQLDFSSAFPQLFLDARTKASNVIQRELTSSVDISGVSSYNLFGYLSQPRETLECLIW